MQEMTKQEMRNIIDGKRTREHIPNLCSFWVMPDLCGENKEKMEEWKKTHICDIDYCFINMPDLFHAPLDDENYRWAAEERDELIDVGIDNNSIIEDFEEIDSFYETFPSPEYKGLIPSATLDSSKYNLATWWYGLFERHWSIRGMENALMDFFLYPSEVHKLYRNLTDFYKRVIERAAEELHVDGIFVSDDMGSQTGPMFSQEIFRTFFKPYYAEIIQTAHECGLHFWLHSCGNIEVFLADFIDIGLDVIHPIQKYTMDGKRISELYGDRICIMAGFDVQRIIPFGSEEDIRQEVRDMVNTYFRQDGRFLFTMGNASTPDWNPESLNTLFNELHKINTELSENGS